MKLQFYFEKLFESPAFQKFKKENPEAFLAGGFVAIDKEGKGAGDRIHLDYFVPENKKLFSFQLEGPNTERVPVEQVPEHVSKISDNIDFDFQEIELMILDKMTEENIKKEVQKILLSLQNVDGRNYLIGTVFITGLGMIKINIDLEEMKITEFKQKSFLDMMNVFKKEKD